MFGCVEFALQLGNLFVFCKNKLLEVLFSFLGRGGGGQPDSAQTIRRTLHQIGLHGCRPSRKPLLKMIHKKAHKQFAEDKQT